MFIVFFFLWMLLNARVSLEVILLGLLLAAALFLFCQRWLGHTWAREVRVIGFILWAPAFVCVLIGEILKANTQKIAAIVKEELAKKDLELYDIKFEFGRLQENNQIALIDEISGGNMRAYKNGEYVLPLDLEQMMLA